MPRWLGLAPAHSRNCRAESLSQSILETSAPPNSANWNWSARRDRKSTRLNSSHGYISYAVFCLKKKKLHVIHDFFAMPRIADCGSAFNAHYSLMHERDVALVHILVDSEFALSRVLSVLLQLLGF